MTRARDAKLRGVRALLLRRGLTACALGLVLAWAGPAAARTGGHPRAQLVLTVSGGVSLGVYEAGFLYYLLETARENPGLLELRGLTGASAGSINGLLSVLTACGPPEREPERSLFWRTWLPLGVGELFVPADTTALGAFSRQTLERAAGNLKAVWQAGLAADCDVVLGVSTTRVEPRTVRVASDRLELPQMEEKFVLRIRGRGYGRPPLATNYVDPRAPLGQRLLVTDADGAIGFSQIRDLIIASMTFPVAFPPAPLASCPARPDSRGRCMAQDAERDLFIDGGVLDNAPVRLAVRVAGAGLRPGPGGRLRWAEEPNLHTQEVPEGVLFAFLMPDLTDFPTYESAAATDPTHSLVALLSQVTKGLVSTARSQELAAVVEERPELVQQMVPPQRHFPAASAPMGAFLGFFEREFRVVDFNLGMYDARRTLEEAMRQDMKRTGELPAIAYPETASLGAGSADPWRGFTCMRAVFDAAEAPANACAGDDLREYRILLRTALERLYSDCRLTRGAGEGNPHCAHARAGGAPPTVPGIDEPPEGSWQRSPAESEIGYTMRRLAQYRFTFADLGLDAGQADQALPRIRAQVGEIGRRLTAAQPLADRELVAIGTKAAADAIAYQSPRSTLHLVLGPVSEIGWSQVLTRPWRSTGPLRLELALGFRGLEHLTASGSHDWSMLALAGLELEPGWAEPMAQLRFGLRGGYEFSSRDSFASGNCEGFSDAPGACSRLVVQAVAGVSVFERLRLQIVGAWYPSTRQRESAAWEIIPGFGLEYGF